MQSCTICQKKMLRLDKEVEAYLCCIFVWKRVVLLSIVKDELVKG
jgi:hypothetical protein